MSSHFTALFHQRLNAWRARRLAARIERLELWMEAMPISSDAPNYAVLAERVSYLRRRLDGLRMPVRPTPTPQRTGFRPSTQSATF